MDNDKSPTAEWAKASFASQLLLQVGGILITIFGLTFTVTRPTLDRLDDLRQDVTELKATTKASDTSQEQLDVRLRRIENDLYQLRREYSNDKRPTPAQ